MRFALFDIHLWNDIAALSNGRAVILVYNTLRTKRYVHKAASACSYREDVQFSYFIRETALLHLIDVTVRSRIPKKRGEYRCPTIWSRNKKRSLNEAETGGTPRRGGAILINVHGDSWRLRRLHIVQGIRREDGTDFRLTTDDGTR